MTTIALYDGVCIGGPKDGDHISSFTHYLLCEIYQAPQIGPSKDDLLLLPPDKIQYTFVQLLPSTRDHAGRLLYKGAWVLSGIQDKLSCALEELIYNYRPKQGE